ncbi:hypothetical protein [Mesorhizobium sp. M0802]|uniref:hypothetical protein n=1 Tax=Mesorhizobium sp. M0802 TaxID=2957001 RepID=UPI00333B4AE8
MKIAVTLLFFLIFAFPVHALTSKERQDALVLGLLANECGWKLKSKTAGWLTGLWDASPQSVTGEAEWFARNQLRDWTKKLGRKEACRRFRGMLADLDWL